jgi:hypothetical protein
MPSTINASTSAGGGIIQTADASGVLALQAAGTTIASVSSAGVAINGSTSGSITLAAPAASGSTTITLPASTGNALVDVARSIADPGYVRFSNGLIMQWGTISVPAGTATVTYPLAFPTGTLSAQVTIQNAGTTDFFAPKIESDSATQLVIRNTDALTFTANWFALGN